MSVASEVAWHRARHEHARLALEQVIRACRDAGVEVLPVKGVLTAHLFYPDPGQRPIQDVDLRVRPEDLRRVLEIGQRSGWRLVSRSRAYGTLSFDVLGFLVEFEAHVGPPGLCELRVVDMLRRATSETGALGVEHLEPEANDHALLLCVNAFKDKLVDALPGAVRDLELLPAGQGFSSKALVALARDVGATTILWIVASWLVRTRRATSWDLVRDELASSPPRPLYTAVLEQAVEANPARLGLVRVIARAGADRRAQRLLAFGTMAFHAIEDAIARRRVPNGGGPRRTKPAVTRLSPIPMSSDR